MHSQAESAKREEVLFVHLVKSFQEWQHGYKVNLNKIVEEVSKKGKDSKQIEMWVEMFSRLLIKLCKTNQDPKVLFDIVLYRMPWFTSETHFQILHSFDKFLFRVISLYPTQIKSIYHCLVSKLQLVQTRCNDSLSKYSIPVEVMETTFANKTLLNDRIQTILQGYSVEMEDQLYNLNERDKAFMREIFSYHPQTKSKLGNLKDIAVGQFPSQRRSKCFYIVKWDGSFDDISYIKSVENLYDQVFREKHIRESNEDARVYKKIIKLIGKMDQVYKLHQPKLVEQIAEVFPHKSQSDQQLKTYVANILKLSEKIPSLQPKIVRLIFLKLLSIDSEIKSESPQKIIVRCQQFRPSDHKDDMLKKLDQLIYVLLEFLSQKDKIDLKAITKELHQVFSENVLPNSNYRMVHFILFYLCSIDSDFQKNFISRLILNVTSESHLCTLSQSVGSLFYLSSLLTRHKNIDKAIYLKSVEFVLAKSEAQTDPNELTLHIVQFLAYMLATQFTHLDKLAPRIINELVSKHHHLKAFHYLHYDIVVKLNELLLKQKLTPEGQQLVDLTASIIMKAFTENTLSSSSQIQSPIKDTKMLMQKESDSIWTIEGGSKLKKIKKNHLEFRQPFQSLSLIYCEQFFKMFYKSDQELISENELYVKPKRKLESPQLVKKLKQI